MPNHQKWIYRILKATHPQNLVLQTGKHIPLSLIPQHVLFLITNIVCAFTSEATWPFLAKQAAPHSLKPHMCVSYLCGTPAKIAHK